METRILLIGIIVFFVNLISVNAQVIKNGSCPGGWNSSGKYCLEGSSAKGIMLKVGSCPSGCNSSGNYCVK